jgi:hypothetical protein
MAPAVVSGIGLALAALLLLAVLDAVQVMRDGPAVGFDVGSALMRVTRPVDTGGWIQLAGIAAFALVGGVFIAATWARRRTRDAS